MNIIRWLILLPVSYVVGMIIMLIINAFFASAIPGGLEAIDTEFSFYKLLRQLLSGFAQGFVFIALGVTIAPDYKKNTAITLVLIQILLIISILSFGSATVSWQAKLGGIAQIIGSILAYNVYLRRI